MKKIGCLIVDDEPIARDILKTYVLRLPELNLLGECKNATEAYEAMRRLPVNLVLLDIQMPVITGTIFLRSLQKPPLVIFTTAYADYAVEGFELDAVDYLLKPVTFERFCQAVQKVHQRMLSSPKPVYPQETPSYIFIKQNTKLLKVDFEDICYIQAERDFCSVYLTDGKRLLVGMHLKRFEKELPTLIFRRVHRSFIVNIKKIKSITGNQIGITDTMVPIGNNYRDELFEILGLKS